MSSNKVGHLIAKTIISFNETKFGKEIMKEEWLSKEKMESCGPEIFIT